MQRIGPDDEDAVNCPTCKGKGLAEPDRPAGMDIARACDILNAHKHGGCKWESDGIDTVHGLISKGPYQVIQAIFTAFQAIAVAEKLDREKGQR